MNSNEVIKTEKLSPEQELDVCRAMMELSGDIAFEWDMLSDTILLSDKWAERFLRPTVHFNFSADVASLDFFHPEDLAALADEIGRMHAGAEYGESVVRIKALDGGYTWNRIRAAAEYEDDRLKKIIGTIADIDSEKRKSQALLAKAEHDSLTGLLNKDTARLRVEQYLETMDENQHAALLVIDLDNFKAVNDLYGHLFGDTVLSHVGSTIRGLFRESDILARIGGDEFLVLVRDIPDMSLVEHRCVRLTQTMQQIYGRQLEQCQFSCSVGVAMIPEHGTNYQTLFQRADRALYQAKDVGKNTYAIFSMGTDTKRYEKLKPRMPKDVGLLSDWSDTALYMLEQLYETQSVSEAFRAILSMVGSQLQAEHIFVVNMPNATPMLEWLHPRLASEKAGFAELPINVWEEASSLINEDGLFYCHDVELTEGKHRELMDKFGAKALLLCAVLKNGEICGYVGIRSICDTKIWMQKEIDAVSFISRMASMFLWASAKNKEE